MGGGEVIPRRRPTCLWGKTQKDRIAPVANVSDVATLGPWAYERLRVYSERNVTQLVSPYRIGKRLDECGEGHGFGLSITGKLADLYGGGLVSGMAKAGGLCVTLNLPQPSR